MAPMLVVLRSRYARCFNQRKDAVLIMLKRLVSIITITKLMPICVAIFLLTRSVFAQEIGGGTLNGTVTDPSGAAITSAKVTATQSSGTGVYSFSSLSPGVYDVQIEAGGFKTAKMGAVTLGVGGVITLDVK